MLVTIITHKMGEQEFLALAPSAYVQKEFLCRGKH